VNYFRVKALERLIHSNCQIRRKLLESKARATLAQLVERLIRNFHVPGYAIDSTVGYRVVPSVHSASRALIESDFESNFRVARGSPAKRPTVIENMVRESGLRTLASSLGIWAMFCFQ